MRFPFALIVVPLFGTAAAADSVVVRAGEHPDFVRLALEVPEGAEWRTDERGTVFEIRFAGGDLAIDTSLAFDRIGREIVAAVAVDGTALEIRRTCDCPVRVTTARPNLVVLDVSREPASPGTARLQGAGGAARPVADLPPDARAGVPGPAAGPGEDVGGYWLRALLHGGMGRNAGPASPADAALFAALSRDISGAGPAPRGDAPAALAEPSPPVAPKPAGTGIAVPSPSLDPFSGIGDLAGATLDNRSAERIEIAASVCPRPDLVDLPGWGTRDTDLTLARSQLADIDPGRMGPDQVLPALRSFLYLGFGAEAELLAEAFDVEIPAPTRAMVAVIEDRDTTGFLSAHAHCGGAYALWGALEGGAEGIRNARSINDIVTEFRRLPPPLRLQFRDRLVAALEDAGFEEEAATLNMSAVALARVADPGATAGDQGAPSAAPADPEGSAAEIRDRLIAEITDAFDRGRPVPPDLVDLSLSMWREMAGTPQEDSLRAAHARALLSNAQFEPAFDVILGARWSEEDAGNPVAAQAFRLLVREAEDDVFLTLVFERIDFERDPIPAGLVVDAAERLVDLGFHDRAGALLARARPVGSPERIDLLMAEALIEGGRPDEALVRLAGQTGEEATRLRGRALAQLGDYAQAFDSFGAISDDGALSELAWTTGDWAVLAGSDAEFRQLQDVLQSDPAIAQDAPITLQDASRLTASSSETLEAVRALLDQARVD